MVGGDKNKEQATKKYQKSYFDVLGLCCSSEVPLIEKILKPLDGIKEVSVIVPSRTVIVLHDNLIISQLQIATLLNQARLEANIRVYGETKFSNKWPSPYAIACGVCLLLSFLKYVYHPFQWLALGAVVIGILPIVLKGYAALRNFTLDTNILVLIAVMGSIALRDYWEAGSIVFLFTIAQWLESRASHKANAVMSSLMNMVPQKAVMAESGEEVDASEVKVESILAVKPGEIIPIDGIVVDGKCDVDEKTLTGESFPIPKQSESTVWAGTINLNGYISVKTTALAEDCMVARMAKLVEEAQNNKSKTQRFIDKCAKFYTPAIVAISISLAAIPAILRVHNQRHWFHLALVVLVSACPCALILSTPVATFCALSKAATSGLLIKGGEYLETLSKIKIMGFDKTGTITRGEFMVKEFQTLVTDVSINELLYWVSSIESKSSHPMAAALIDYGRSHSIEPNSEDVQEFENFPGEGIHGKIDGKDIYVGNRKIALRAGCETVPSLKGTVGEGKSIGYVLLGGVPAGVFSLSDTCRSGAKEAINDLKSMGIKTAMLTGDSNEAAIQAQNQLEGCLEVVHAELLPQDKANIIKQFQKEAPTAMVGDGLNDAPALATADIGISMGVSGSALATETGHVILMSNDIRKIPKVITLSRRTRNKVIQNVVLSILTKSGILVLAFVGYPLVWAAVLADVGTCLVVIFNSMLLLKGEENQTEKCCKSSWKTGFRKQGCDSDHGCHSSHSHKHEHLAERDVEHSDNKLLRKRGCKSHACHSSHSHEHSIGVKKIHCSTSCNGHGSSSNLGQTNGCCSNGDQLKEAKHLYNKLVRNQWCKSHSCHSSHTHEHEHSIGVGKIHHPTSCDSHENCSNPGQTNGCCVNKDRLKETEHSNNKHFGKQGCKSHSCYSSHSHKHEHSIRVEKNHDHSMLRDSHGNCPNSGRANGCYVNKDRLKEAEHSDHKNLGSNSEHKHCCSGLRVSNHCEPKKCTNLVKKQSNCGKRDVVQGHFDHISPNDIHCHSTHCNNKHRETRAIDDEEAVLDQTNDEHEKYEVDFPCSSIHKNKELEASRACLELEKRHIGGCCRSFREECCGRNKQFGESFRGGLSEIIIE